MKQDIAEYLSDSFIDYKGDTRSIIICALSQSPEPDGDDHLMVGWSDGQSIDDSADIYHDVYRAVSVGIAICCPQDMPNYSEDIGKKIALSRANKSLPRFVSLFPGVVNTPIIRAFLRQEMEYIKKYPEKFIGGYELAKNRYEKNLNFEKTIKNLSNDEATVVQAAIDGVDIIKCAKLARQLLDKKIRELESNS